MAIQPYTKKNGKQSFLVYVQGLDAKGNRIQRRRKGIESIQKAKALEFELMRDLAMLREEKIPFRWHEWLTECLKRIKVLNRPSTVVNYEKTLGKWITPHWRDLEIQTITKTQIHSIIFDTVSSKLSPHTRRTVLKMVRRIFQMAVEDGALDRNPCAGIKVQVPEVDQKVLNSKEAEKFLLEAKRTRHRFYSAWVMALKTGMRSGELFALKWTAIDLEVQLISVTKQWTSKNGITSTKTQKNRVVPISEDLVRFLKELKLRRTSETDYVLPRLPEWERGEQARITKEFCIAIGITPVKFHDLRATFITSLLSNGESLAKVMSIVGHSQLRTTNGYLRKAGVDVVGVTDRLGYKLPKDVLENRIIPFRRDSNGED